MIAVVESLECVPWTKPDEIPYTLPASQKEADEFIRKLGRRRTGFNALLADGEVRFIDRMPSPTPEQLDKMIGHFGRGNAVP